MSRCLRAKTSKEHIRAWSVQEQSKNSKKKNTISESVKLVCEEGVVIRNIHASDSLVENVTPQSANLNGNKIKYVYLIYIAY